MKLLTNIKNYMKMQKLAVFVKKILKLNLLKIKDVVNLEIVNITLVNTEMLHRY